MGAHALVAGTGPEAADEPLTALNSVHIAPGRDLWERIRDRQSAELPTRHDVDITDAPQKSRWSIRSGDEAWVRRDAGTPPRRP
jgi:hypothetical protein